MRGAVANVSDPDAAPNGCDGVGEGALAVPGGGVGRSALSKLLSIVAGGGIDFSLPRRRVTFRQEPEVGRMDTGDDNRSVTAFVNRPTGDTTMHRRMMPA